jgi:hypothetical protein
MVHLTGGDVKEVPTIERSFLAGETSRNFVFEITNWNFRIIIHHGFGDANPGLPNLKKEFFFITIIELLS